MAQALRTYRRPMGAWWRRHPFYRWYMLREASCVAITVYALILLVGLARLQQGPQAFAAWQDSLRHPLSVAFHVVALVLVIYHSWTWFKVMPKTLPRLPVPDGVVVAAGVTGVLLVSALVLWSALW